MAEDVGHTEEEAKAKWCPFARSTQGEATREGAEIQLVGGCNRAIDYEAPHDCRCIGSTCMAWRWYVGPAFERRADQEFQRSGKTIKPETGYCGLARSPQS